MKTTPNSSTVTETKGGTLTTKCIASRTNQKTEISTSFANKSLVDESNPTGSNTGNNPPQLIQQAIVGI